MTTRVLCEREKSIDYVVKKIYATQAHYQNWHNLGEKLFNLTHFFHQKDQIYCSSNYFIYQLWQLRIFSIVWKILITSAFILSPQITQYEIYWTVIYWGTVLCVWCDTKDLCICSLPPQQFHHELFTQINSCWPLIKTECLKKPAPHSQSESKCNLSSKPPVRVGLTLQTSNWVVCQCVLDVEVDFRTLVRHTEASRLPCLLCSHRFKTEQNLKLSLIIKEQC